MNLVFINDAIPSYCYVLDFFVRFFMKFHFHNNNNVVVVAVAVVVADVASRHMLFRIKKYKKLLIRRADVQFLKDIRDSVKRKK